MLFFQRLSSYEALTQITAPISCAFIYFLFSPRVLSLLLNDTVDMAHTGHMYAIHSFLFVWESHGPDLLTQSLATTRSHLICSSEATITLFISKSHTENVY